MKHIVHGFVLRFAATDKVQALFMCLVTVGHINISGCGTIQSGSIQALFKCFVTVGHVNISGCDTMQSEWS